MGYFTKSDDRFVESAIDDARRGTAIADLTSRRVGLFWCIILFAVGSITLAITGGSGFGVGGVVFYVIMVGVMFKMESELRLLKIVDRLRKEGRQPPA